MSDDTDDRIVIQYPWVRKFVWGFVLSILAAALVYIIAFDRLAAAFFSVATLIRYGAEKRRRLEITKDDVAYWPPLWPQRRVKFADISSIEKTKVGRWFGAKLPELVPGVEFHLVNYDELQIPLDLPNSDEVYEKIYKAWESQRAAR